MTDEPKHWGPVTLDNCYEFHAIMREDKMAQCPVCLKLLTLPPKVVICIHDWWAERQEVCRDT